MDCYRSLRLLGERWPNLNYPIKKWGLVWRVQLLWEIVARGVSRPDTSLTSTFATRDLVAKVDVGGLRKNWSLQGVSVNVFSPNFGWNLFYYGTPLKWRSCPSTFATRSRVAKVDVRTRLSGRQPHRDLCASQSSHDFVFLHNSRLSPSIGPFWLK